MADEKHLEILRQGVEVWNQWRERNPHIRPDIEGADLSGAWLFGANLSGANLVNAWLFGANLSGANLERANLVEADLIEANLSGANLIEADLERANLLVAKLSGANLSGANLERANLERANLERADLSSAYLNQVQGLQTNFDGATLTAACIEDWNINSKTNLQNVKCDYIFLKYNQDRCPHDPNKIFAPGEFAQLFQKALETVDLIFSDGIDWQAFLVSFNKLQIECDSDELSINSFENKGNGAFVIRVNVPDGADKAEIEKYLKRQYQLEAQLESKTAQLESKTQDYNDLYEITKLLAGRTIKVTSQSSGNTTYNTDQAGIVHNEKSDISDSNIAGVYNEAAKQDLTQAADEIQQLLDQLQKTNDVTLEVAQQQTAKDLATKAQNDPNLKDRLINLGKFIGDNSAKTIVSEGVKGVIKLFLLIG